MNDKLLHLNTVLVADDHPIVTERICDILTQYYDIDNIIVLNDANNIAIGVTETNADLYILDLEFKNISGFDLIKLLKSKNSNAKIIINTMHDQVWTIYQLQQMAVDGIILKSELAPSSLYFKNAIDSVMEGGHYYSPSIEELQQNILNYKKRLRTKQSIPSEAELAVLRHIVNGHTSREIGKLLCISEDTVEGHRKNLFLKLDARNVAHLVAIAYQNRLLE